VAVIGTGADRIYPARNAELARQIATGGVVLSEFPLGTPALAGNFPRRNRIIAGLALGTLVVEAAPQSGSLITARLAAEAGREVFAIPGSIHAPQYKGCHQLIRQGAKLVETARDVLDELRWEQKRKDRQASLADFDQPAVSIGKHKTEQSKADERVLTLLSQGPLELDMLTQLSGLTAGELLAILLTHELAGRVAPLPGGLYQRLH
jgi:DNA processing protein